MDDVYRGVTTGRSPAKFKKEVISEPNKTFFATQAPMDVALRSFTCLFWGIPRLLPPPFFKHLRLRESRQRHELSMLSATTHKKRAARGRSLYLLAGPVLPAESTIPGLSHLSLCVIRT